MEQNTNSLTVLFSIPGNAYQATQKLDNPGFDPGGAKRFSPIERLLKLNPQGDILLFDPSVNILSKFSSEGQLIEKLSLGQVESGLKTLDFCATEQGYALLQKKNASEFILFFSLKAEPLHTLSVSDLDLGRGKQVLPFGDDILFVPDQYPLKYAQISFSEGKVKQLLDWDSLDDDARMAPNGQLINVISYSESGDRGTCLLNLKTGIGTSRKFESQWRMHLLGLIGGDETGASYFYGHPNLAKEPGIYKFDANGNLLAQFNFQQITSNGSVITYWNKQDGTAQVHILNEGKSTLKQVNLLPENFDLAGLTKSGAVLLIQENKAGLPGDLITIAAAELPFSQSPIQADITVYRNQKMKYWLVKPNGEILIPVCTPEGLTILALNLN